MKHIQFQSSKDDFRTWRHHKTSTPQFDMFYSNLARQRQVTYLALPILANILAIYLWALLQTRAFSLESTPERSWDPCKSVFCLQMRGPCHHWTLLVPETGGRKEICHVCYAIQYYVGYSGTDISIHNNGSFTSKSSISPNENSGMSKCPLIFLFSSLINHSPDKRYNESLQ